MLFKILLSGDALAGAATNTLVRLSSSRMPNHF